MRYGTKSQGYTILEVMIFLAISGFMFVIAASFINGKQSRAEIKQGMSAINLEIQGTINAVSNGYYPATTSFKCSALSSGPLTFAAPTADTEQGNNKGCVFLGKFIQFGDPTNPALNADINYNVYSVVGRQFASGAADPTKLPTKFVESFPTVAPNITVKKALYKGLSITKITESGTDITGVGFINSFSNYNATSGNLESGSQNVTVVTLPVSGTGRNQNAAAMKTQIEGLADTDIKPNPNILICFVGNGNQYGTLTIGGGNGSRLTTKVQISGNQPTGC